MGINSSGVRQIAEAVGSGDAVRIAHTTIVLRRISIVLGALGAALLLVFSRPISALTFGDTQHAASVGLLSLAVLFTLVSAGQGALVQGLRRIADLAKMGLLGALSGTLFSIPLVYFFREEGVVPSLVSFAALSLITSWWYSRKVEIQTTFMTAAQVGQESAALLKLGFAFMATGLMTIGSAYVVRIIVLRTLGFEATGMYQSAWTLGGLYVGFILQAMGADFYPRLTASANDNTKCNRLVNEQTQVGLLLAGPGVIATLAFAPVVIGLLYSPTFGGAVGILRWICLGATIQVISWPLGFIIVAKSERVLFFASDLLWSIVHIALALTCVRYFGLNGAGIAFFGSYIFHVFLTYAIVRRLSGFRWSADNKQTGLIFLSLISVVFCGLYWLPQVLAACVGALATALGAFYSIRTLLTLVSINGIPRPICRALEVFRLAPSGSAGIS
jgi:PST family polysaccharide transporter